MRDYSDFVEEGKFIANKLKEITALNKAKTGYQIKIAKLALEVCEISLGGKTKERYTIVKYANDIDLKPETVKGWIGIYRDILLRIDIKDPTSGQWKQAAKTKRILHYIRKNKINHNVSDLELKKAFSLVKTNPFITKFSRAMADTVHIRNLMTDGDLTLIDESSLIELMENLDIASDTINDYLSDKKRSEMKSGKLNG